MTAKRTARLPADFGITHSLSQPRVSGDNPFSGVYFTTLKYHPGLARRFAGIAVDTVSCRTLVRWRNDQHHHGES